MPTKDGENIVERNPNGTVKKGSVLNPQGKKPGTRHMTTILREAIVKVAEDTGTAHDVEIVKKAIQDAKAGDFQKMKLIFNYLDGMPPQDIDLTTAGQPFQVITHVPEMNNAAD